MGSMNIEEILAILPHRYPFLLVDRILEYDVQAGTIVGLKNVTTNEGFFQGHFPGNPVMPGVLQLEAMAQVGGILLNKQLNREGQVAYFTSVDKARFRRIVRPGDQLRIEVVFDRVRMGIAKVHGQTLVEGAIASEADLKFAAK